MPVFGRCLVIQRLARGRHGHGAVVVLLALEHLGGGVDLALGQLVLGRGALAGEDLGESLADGLVGLGTVSVLQGLASERELGVGGCGVALGEFLHQLKGALDDVVRGLDDLVILTPEIDVDSRDRLDVEQHTESGGVRVRGADLDQALQQTDRAGPCLLYTSDAADE